MKPIFINEIFYDKGITQILIKGFRLAMYIVSILLITILLFEGLLHVLLNSPFILKILPNNAIAAFRHYYYEYEFNIIQFDSNCARYDSELFYTLKPGQCRHKAPEFNNLFKINKEGLRDDEWSLKEPELIVLGDSHAMGLGVDQDETFAQVIEQKTGMKVLNVAVSSYGTVREARILNRIYTDNLRYLIIQYNTNDFNENAVYFLNNNNLLISSLKKWEKKVFREKSRNKYYPAKYIRKLFISSLINGKTSLRFVEKRKRSNKHKILSEHRDKVEDLDEASLFINALTGENKINMQKVQVLVFKIANSGYSNKRPSFKNSLEKIKKSDFYPEYIINMKILDIENELKQKKYRYTLDHHLTPAGHEFIAENIIKMF